MVKQVNVNISFINSNIQRSNSECQGVYIYFNIHIHTYLRAKIHRHTNALLSSSPCSSHAKELCPEPQFLGNITSKSPNLLKMWQNFNSSSILAQVCSAMSVLTHNKLSGLHQPQHSCPLLKCLCRASTEHGAKKKLVHFSLSLLWEVFIGGIFSSCNALQASDSVTRNIINISKLMRLSLRVLPRLVFMLQIGVKLLSLYLYPSF